MNAKISVFTICVEEIKYYYLIICMTVPLKHVKISCVILLQKKVMWFDAIKNKQRFLAHTFVLSKIA